MSVTGAITAGEAMSAAAEALEAAGVESPRLDAELLLAASAGISREQLIADPEVEIEPAAGRRFGEAVRRRLRREPLAYITGRRWFRQLEIEVDGRVLIPRPETELLVDVALELRPRRMLDVGTGSGAVALAVAAELPDVDVVATDCSPAALEVARANAERVGLAERVRFLEGSLPAESAFDLLLANLPYVADDEWPQLQPEIRDWEPREALLGGPDGLAQIGALLAQLRERAGRGAAVPDAVALEIGAGQHVNVSAMLDDAGYRTTDVRRDLAGIERVVIGGR